MTNNVIEINNLSKHYSIHPHRTGTLQGDFKLWLERKQNKPSSSKDDFWALRNINLEIQAGDRIGLIGRNGAGKSTLLKILSRITAPTLGEVKIKGRVASMLEVGTGFHRELTGRENIFLNGAILGMRRREIRARIDEIVDFSGVEKFLDTPVKKYSSGMYVRLAFSVAAHLPADILLVDEVLALGDTAFRQKALQKMEQLTKEQGKSILFVSHNLSSVRRLCNRSILMKGGVIDFQGETQSVINNYLKDIPNSLQQPRKNVYSSGDLKLKFVRVSSDREKDINPQTGQPILFIFELEGNVDFLSQQVQFDFRIDNNRGEHLFWLSSSLKPEPIRSKQLVFSLPYCHLLPNKYFITSYVSVDGKGSDWLENAASFTVLQNSRLPLTQFIPEQQSSFWFDFDLYS